ncbi:hypothetical protein B9Z55_004576 [Caenorhabditis nigoni]|uniref:Protein phosphatase 1 regulatory subunit 11 n=1 Tax=Caenorhabditis nigoni TaxID=1611254 RepID=A0A2G5UX44_9PELO|nr:hypothetical protein B9Z55_004576 [Caenorhabditis nigoni]
MSRIAGITTTCQVEEGVAQEQEQQPAEQLVLRLRSTNPRPHVTWGASVVDNEHMGRLKSNCCCIYTPPRRWDDPSTWEPEEHETEHCRGHTLPEKKKKEDKDDKENKHDGCACDHC